MELSPGSRPASKGAGAFSLNRKKKGPHPTHLNLRNRGWATAC